MRVAAQATTVQRGQNAFVTAQFRVVDRGIGLVSIDMQRAATAEIEHREGMNMLVVAAAHDRALAVLGHDKRQRGGIDLARVKRNSVFGGHVLKHASQPIVGYGCNEIRYDPKFGAAERSSYCVAAE